MAKKQKASKVLSVCRPAYILSDNLEELDAEFRAARWAHHRLLDFEDKHQAVLDKAQKLCAPRFHRASRILARLRKQNRIRPRSTGFVPRARPELQKSVEEIKNSLRAQRDKDPIWKAALKWDEESNPDAHVVQRRRTKGMSDEEFEAKKAEGKTRSRRTAHQAEFYLQRRCFYATWNHLIRSVKQARSAVIKQRAKGLPADWRRPKWDDNNTIVAEDKQYKILERDKNWWTIQMRLHSGWVTFRTIFGNWHHIPEGAKMGQLKLTRRKDGRGWKYSASLLVDGSQYSSPIVKGTGIVALDWGHREHQHPTAHLGIRAFTWRGDDSVEGEILLPAKCRELKDKANLLKSRIDETFNARKASLGLPDRNRYSYRRRLNKQGVRTECEHNWLRWETRNERQITACNGKIANIRRETYTRAVRKLLSKYASIAIEEESTKQYQPLDKEEMTRHRKRENRDMTSRYELVSLCKRFGGDVIAVPSHNSTRECPDPECDGILPENGTELMVACPMCGVVRDKDRGACVVLLRRGQEVLAKRLVAA